MGCGRAVLDVAVHAGERGTGRGDNPVASTQIMRTGMRATLSRTRATGWAVGSRRPSRKNLRSQRDSGSCDRKFVRRLIEVIAPRLSEVEAGIHERSDQVGLGERPPAVDRRARWWVLPWWQTDSIRDDVLGTYVPAKVLD
jgi:hypothetical protein